MRNYQEIGWVAITSVKNGRLLVPAGFPRLTDDNDLLMSDTIIRKGWLAYISTLCGLERIVRRVHPVRPEWRQKLDKQIKLDHALLSQLTLFSEMVDVRTRRGRLEIPKRFRPHLSSGDAWLIHFDAYTVVTTCRSNVDLYEPGLRGWTANRQIPPHSERSRHPERRQICG